MKSMLRATVLMSSSSFITLLFSLVKNKAFAVLLGVGGVGLFGILLSVFNIGVSLGGIATGGSVVKELTGLITSKNDRIEAFRQAIISFCFLVSGGMFLLIMIFRSFISELINYHLTFIDSILLALAIVFSNLSALQLSWFNAFGAIKNIAFTKAIASFLALIVSVGILLFLKSSILALLILLPPLSLFIVGLFNSRGIPLFSVWNFKKIFSQSNINYQKQVLTVGIVLMLSSLIAANVNLITRVIIENKFTMTGVGLFQSAWSVSMTYIEILLASISVYFFPVFISKANFPKEAADFLNKQIEQLIFICIPVILAMFVFSKLALIILYNTSFIGATNILRWQLIGDIFKICVWVFGYVLIAYNKLFVSILVQLLWGAIYIGVVFFLSNCLGINSAGFGFFLAYAALFLFYILYFKYQLNIAINLKNLVAPLVATIGALTILVVDDYYNNTITMLFGSCWITVTLLLSIQYFTKKTNLISEIWKKLNL